MELTFQPGEYRLYTDVKLEAPDISTGINDISLSDNNELNLITYPNPVGESLKVVCPGLRSNRDIDLSILDLTGKVIYHDYINYWEEGRIEEVNTSRMEPGVYILRVVSGGGVGVAKFLK